ncbi:glycoside hydrolase family 3 protein [Actinomadura oligospora]|uniref:glycoside hydrolase family 3 protein n=1 Tax=Actinomadura oligospora TaxID=111804 RepID=UPI00047AA0DE|nr:glycoside hydrolase family 3 C-terminal domain-containing protein [Actinomadura oligospora]
MNAADREARVEEALARLDLDAKASLLSGQDLWTLPALPEIGLASIVMSDGPVGVRGTAFDPSDTSLTLPSPTALAATWDPDLARRAGRALAAEAHRKGVHVLLAPTVNLHRSPLGGRHFECYSEDPLLTARIGAAHVTGVQECGVAATVKHFVANDAETERFTVTNRIGERALRELYLAPFEQIVAEARPWLVMSAYNAVNGPTMTENRELQSGVLRGEWGFDGVVVSDWLAARDTVRAIEGGLDVAMPGPRTVFGRALAAAVRDGRVSEKSVDDAVRNVLRLAARVGLLDGLPPEVPAESRPVPEDGRAVAREIATRSFVLLHNRASVLPLDPAVLPGGIALIGRAAEAPRVLGGGSATVFPERVVSLLDALRDALPEATPLTHEPGTDLTEALAVAGEGFDLWTVLRAERGAVLAQQEVTSGRIRWTDSSLPGGVDYDALATVELTGRFTPRESGSHTFGTRGVGAFTLTVDGHVLFDGEHRSAGADPLEALTGRPIPRGDIELRAGEPVEVVLLATTPKMEYGDLRGVSFALAHAAPARSDDPLIDRAVAAAASADVAVVVVATTEAVESEGFDRETLRLPGRQDDLVARVAAANPRTVVVVNAGSPVEMPWRDDVAAVLLSWFPGQEGGAALADVLLGLDEPGGRLPTTWLARLTDAPVTRVTPEDGVLPYDEGVFIGYRAWQRHPAVPAYPFGHGLGYTTWTYETLETTADSARVRVRNTGDRPGRETVQLYVGPAEADPSRPTHWLAGFATATAAPGEMADIEVPLPLRAFQIWDEETSTWTTVPGDYRIHAAHDATDLRLTTTLTIP